MNLAAPEQLIELRIMMQTLDHPEASLIRVHSARYRPIAWLEELTEDEALQWRGVFEMALRREALEVAA